MFTRTFLADDTVTGLMFFIIVFLHVAVPAGLFFLIWIHVIRTSRPVINPPRLLSIGIIIVLVALALFKPATSTPAADLNKVPAVIPIDWFYLFIYPLFAAISPGVFWLISTLGTVLLVSVPWLARHERPPSARIITENCVGCEQCYYDCPYEAIYMTHELLDEPYMKAVIIPKRCASCGTCIGSCDYGAVELAGWTDVTVKKEVSRILSLAPVEVEGPRVFGFVCDHTVETRALMDPGKMVLKDVPGVSLMTLPCIGMVLPSFVEHALAHGADGVFICGCKPCDCYYREGNMWLEARISGVRPPVMKKSTDPSRVRVYLLSALQSEELLNEVRLFIQELASRGEENESKVIRKVGYE
jgi:coenzyme F420-reducing hydrogenase delta subunit/ferredoxin